MDRTLRWPSVRVARIGGRIQPDITRQMGVDPADVQTAVRADGTAKDRQYPDDT
jgi:hypothetical protein